MPKTFEQITYHKLRDFILENRFPHGEFLSQRKLAQEVGATLMTLRSSLRLLENDGLIENVPKWGVRIPLETPESLGKRYYFREIIEVGAVAAIREQEPPYARARLLEKARACDALRLDDTDSFRRFARLHTQFHLAITELSDNELLTTSLERVNFRSMMLSNAKYGWEIYLEHQQPEHHQRFVEEIFDLPVPAALDAVRRHIRRGYESERAAQEKQQAESAGGKGKD